MGALRISELAKLSGISASALRFYEDCGLLSAERTPSGYRVYDDETTERLAFISFAKSIGLTLREIRDLLPAWQSRECASMRARLAPLVNRQIADAERRRAELSDLDARLTRARDGLRSPAPDGPCTSECGCTAASGHPQPAIACTLTHDDLVERSTEWRAVLEQARYRSAIESRPTGVAFEIGFDNQTALVSSLAYLIAAEQQCCRFYTFVLHLSDDQVVLEVRAPQDATPLVNALFGGFPSPEPVSGCDRSASPTARRGESSRSRGTT